MRSEAIPKPTLNAAPEARTDRGPFDAAAYWFGIVALYVLQGGLWYYPFKEKVFDDELIAPAPIKKQFADSLIDSFPGTSAAWAILGILQGLVLIALVVSLVRAEFLPGRVKPALLVALAISLVVFALMLFGNSMTSQFDGVSSQFTYFGLTVVLMAFVLRLSSYRPEA